MKRKAVALRNRITQVESAVIDLEAENGNLRAHVDGHGPSAPHRPEGFATHRGGSRDAIMGASNRMPQTEGDK
jgi:hypothetical protein